MTEHPDPTTGSDDAFRRHRAQTWWPQPPGDAPAEQHASHPQEGLPAPLPSPAAALPTPDARGPVRPAGIRTVGAALLGLMLGALAGFVMQDAVAVASLASGGLNWEVVAVFAVLLPLLAVGGAVVGIRIERRSARRHPGTR